MKNRPYKKWIDSIDDENGNVNIDTNEYNVLYTFLNMMKKYININIQQQQQQQENGTDWWSSRKSEVPNKFEPKCWLHFNVFFHSMHHV